MAKKLLIALALIPVWLVAGELLARLVFRLQGEPYSASATRQELLDLQSALSGPVPGLDDGPRAQATDKDVTISLHPYVGWEAISKQVETELARYDDGTYDDQFEVLILGGSVAALTASKGMGAILRVLKKEGTFAGRGVTVLNHGHGSYKEPQMATKLAYLLNLGYRPDAVINIDGFNEVALGLDNVTLGAHPLYPHWIRFGSVAGGLSHSAEQMRRLADVLIAQDELAAEIERTLRWHLDKSAILGRWKRSRIGALRRRWSELQDAATTATAADEHDPALGPTFNRTPEDAIDVIVDSWVESSILIDAMCRAHGIAYLHVLQPTLHDHGSKPLTDGEVATGRVKGTWKRGVELGYPKLREAAPRLIEAGVHFLDATDTFADFPETAYYDACHFRGEAMDLFAERCARELLKQLH